GPTQPNICDQGDRICVDLQHYAWCDDESNPTPWVIYASGVGSECRTNGVCEQVSEAPEIPDNLPEFVFVQNATGHTIRVSREALPIYLTNGWTLVPSEPVWIPPSPRIECELNERRCTDRSSYAFCSAGSDGSRVWSELSCGSGWECIDSNGH